MRWNGAVTRNKRLCANVCTLTKILAVLVPATGISAASEIATIETTQLVNSMAWECAPVWDADGGKLFYASNESGNFDIRRIEADSANKTLITDDPADEFHRSSGVIESYMFHNRRAVTSGSWMQTVQTEANCLVMAIILALH